MSDRIRKSLGYGVVIPSLEESGFNTDALNVKLSSIREELMEDSFTEAMFPHEGEALFEGKLRDCVSVFDIDAYADDCSDVGIIVRPVTERTNWLRYDDPIDFYSASISHPENPMQTVIEYVDAYLWPFDDGFVNVRTGEVMSSVDYRDLKILSGLHTDLNLRAENVNKLQQYERKIPNAVATLLTAAGFATPETAQTLKPMIATWWS